MARRGGRVVSVVGWQVGGSYREIKTYAVTLRHIASTNTVGSWRCETAAGIRHIVQYCLTRHQ